MSGLRILLWHGFGRELYRVQVRSFDRKLWAGFERGSVFASGRVLGGIRFVL